MPAANKEELRSALENPNGRLISPEELSQHNQRGDSWISIEGVVYDVSKFAQRHPGGKVILTYAGEDATDPFHAFHLDLGLVRKYLSPHEIGRLKPSLTQIPAVNQSLQQDFREIREEFHREGLFKTNPWFYVGMLAHIVLLEILGFFVMWYWGISWVPYLVSAIILATAQAQAGWLQHDFGHLSVFPSSKWNHRAHYFVISFMKGASRGWWNWRHFHHHAKPNVVHKDPDIKMQYIFVLGKSMAAKWAEKGKGIMPYGYQHYYWHLTFPPLLLPTYFHIDNLIYVFRNREWLDLFWMVMFFVKHFALYTPLLGTWGAFWFYMFFRSLESHWFVYVTQMNHLPMHIDLDDHRDWASLQNAATCNIEGSWFNDWFTGHLNYQIEHHLFPTMPRHNYSKANVYIRKMFEKHNVPMETKPLGTAMADVVFTLKDYGNIWYDAYYGSK